MLRFGLQALCLSTYVLFCFRLLVHCSSALVFLFALRVAIAVFSYEIH